MGFWGFWGGATHRYCRNRMASFRGSIILHCAICHIFSTTPPLLVPKNACLLCCGGGVATATGVLAVSLANPSLSLGYKPSAGSCVSPVPSYLRNLLSLPSFSNGCGDSIPTSAVPGFLISTCRLQSSLTVFLIAILTGVM